MEIKSPPCFRLTKNQNVVLRPVQVRDASLFFEMVARHRDSLSTYFPKTISANSSLEDSKIYVKEKVAQMESRDFYLWILEDLLTKEILGFLLVKNIEWNIPKAELGYFIIPTSQGNGLGTEALGHLVLYFVRALEFKKLYMRIDPENKPSIRVAEKNNFLCEGRLRNDFRTADGQLIDLLYYGKVF